MAFGNAEIAQIVSTIWQSVLSRECVHTTQMPGASPSTLSACVQITGAWQGAVVLSCTEDFARLAAATMFNIEAQSCPMNDMQDAIAELTNMIGGNMKGLLETDKACQLSLPAVVAGADYKARIPGSRPLNQLAMDCGDNTIVITVLEKQQQQHVAN